jgi:hypothetical protein
MDTTTQKFTVNIEQPILISYEIDAIDEEQAEAIAREKFDNMTREEFNEQGEFGTYYQMQIINEAGDEVSEWN